MKLSALSAVSVVFEKIQKGPSYPIGDGNVYTVDSDRKVKMTKMTNDQQVNITKKLASYCIEISSNFKFLC